MGRVKASKSQRAAVIKKHGKVCHFCGKHPSDHEVTIDHFYPLALGGQNRVDNMVVACRACNESKGCLLLEEYRFKCMLGLSQYSGVIDWKQAADLISKGVKLDLPYHAFYFER